MPRQTTKYSAALEAIRRTPSVAELVEEHGSHFAHDLELEVIVYGRNHAGKKFLPYVRLLTHEPGEEVIREGDIGGNLFYVLVGGAPDVRVPPANAENPNDIGQTRVLDTRRAAPLV